jgi:hypothetical protein
MRRKPFALLALLLVSRLASALPLETAIGSIELSHAHTGTEITLTTAHGHVRLEQGPKLRRYLVRAERTMFVGKRVIASRRPTVYFLVAAALPSTRTRGAGQCGAGTEDFLLLVQWESHGRVLRLSDAMPIQSCLNSFELVSDQGGEMEAPLSGIANPESFRLAWFNHPVYRDASKQVLVEAGKFLVR